MTSHPVVVHLNDDELTAYEQLSYEMSKCVIKGKNGKYKLNKHGEILALKRARIVAGASEKVVSSMEQIEINEKAVERLKRKIILQENQNLKTRAMTDQQMVAWIKKQIEEEAQCYSNR